MNILLSVLAAASAFISIALDSKTGKDGPCDWMTIPSAQLKDIPERVSLPGYELTGEWLPAIVPGTVLNTDVANGLLPEPYYGLNNKIQKGLIPDLAAGRDYYTRWLRTEFEIPAEAAGQQLWLRFDGINYRSEIWINGVLLRSTTGMFLQDWIAVTDFVNPGAKNALLVKVIPVDTPGTWHKKKWGDYNEFHNGGDGNMGLNTSMLMSVGWDFAFMDGIRDRNTGIWRSMYLESTGPVQLRHPFVKASLSDNYTKADLTAIVEVANPSQYSFDCFVTATFEGQSCTKKVGMDLESIEEVVFTSRDFPALKVENPRLWWPVNKGPQEMYGITFTVTVDGQESDVLDSKFGIREIRSDRNTPDGSRVFYINGRRIFVRGSNWIPEAMCRADDKRIEAELRYTGQTGINFLRQWGGGIAESDRFFELCDSLGIMVSQEFWMSGGSRVPADKGVHLANVKSTVKRIRNHPCLAYYVCSNESSELPEVRRTLMEIDGTRGYQKQSECDGIHDGSPYKQVNPMRHYENTASERGSRVDGFNPEYGAPMLPLVESLRKFMDPEDLWPINREVWDYHDGNGFSLVSTMYRDMVNEYGESSSIEEFSRKAQLVAAVNSHSIFEVWNYNKLGYGDRWASGFLFWFHNSPIPQVCGHFYDYYLEPCAALYHSANALEPVHIQYDFLKNTVSAVNDYYKPFEGGTATASIWSLDSRKLWEKSCKVDIAEDGVACDILEVDLDKAVGDVFFIALSLKDASGREVSRNFYWRSRDEYRGWNTLTGPCTSGFQALDSMKPASVSSRVAVVRKDGKSFVEVRMRNASSRIAFFNQLMVKDSDGEPVAPSFYSDNFFTLMPGESKSVTIESPETPAVLELSGWNVPSSRKVLSDYVR
ncbi:MAG: glycoside hydrolase family 2 [Bacteroidales bacterium]|nr:glycoside hydrolase family 2 [Bacteroidales bacterium]